MHQPARRIGKAAATFGIATSAMIAAHCGGHQLVTSLGFGPAPEPIGFAGRGSQQAHHLAHLGHSGSASDASVVHASHAHMLPMASGAFLLAVLGALVALLAVRRRSVVRPPRFATLLGLQLVGFATLELGERIPAGVGVVETLSDRRVLVGLLLQPVVACLVIRICRRAAAVVAEWFAPARTRLTRRVAVRLPKPVGIVPTATPILLIRGPRGPPSVRNVHT